MKKSNLLLILLVIVSLQLLGSFKIKKEGAWCVARPGQENNGYCSEGLDGKGKCVKIYIAGADRCQADQPS